MVALVTRPSTPISIRTMPTYSLRAVVTSGGF